MGAPIKTNDLLTTREEEPLIIIISDENQQPLDTNIIQSLTSGDRISARQFIAQQLSNNNVDNSNE